MITTTETRLVAALLQNGSAAAAAKELGISLSTMYRRMKTDEFQMLYQAVLSDHLRIVSSELMERRFDAVETVCEIMNDETVNAATRLQAAQTILTNDRIYAERLSNIEEKMNTLTGHIEMMDLIRQRQQEDPDFEMTPGSIVNALLEPKRGKRPAASQKPETQYQIDPEYD